MANSYDPSVLATDAVMRARYLLGDTGRLKDDAGATVWLIDQEEIAGLLAGAPAFNEGVAQCADGLATRFAQEPNKYRDEAGVEIDWRDRVRTWLDLANRLRSGEVANTEVPSGRPLARQLDTVDTSELR